MLSRIAWGFRNMALAAARDDSFPGFMRASFQLFSDVWMWIALVLEGRAFAAWTCARRPADPAPRPSEAMASTLGRLLDCYGAIETGLHWRHDAHSRHATAAARGADVLAETAPRVAAWSLPEVPKIERLGLGRVWTVLCPYCRGFHTHLPDEGSRSVPCRANLAPRTYLLRYSGDLPPALREQFCLRMRDDWPRVLMHWPRPAEASLEAA